MRKVDIKLSFLQKSRIQVSIPLQTACIIFNYSNTGILIRSFLNVLSFKKDERKLWTSKKLKMFMKILLSFAFCTFAIANGGGLLAKICKNESKWFLFRFWGIRFRCIWEHKRPKRRSNLHFLQLWSLQRCRTGSFFANRRSFVESFLGLIWVFDFSLVI